MQAVSRQLKLVKKVGEFSYHSHQLLWGGGINRNFIYNYSGHMTKNEVKTTGDGLCHQAGQVDFWVSRNALVSGWHVSQFN